jgi:trafficking protein particle complex subunit 5
MITNSKYVSNVVWRHLFNKEADSLQRSMENEDECKRISCPNYFSFEGLPDMIHENNPVTNTFVSLPADMGQLNCAAYLAGIIAGVLDSAKFVRFFVPYIFLCGFMNLY